MAARTYIVQGVNMTITAAHTVLFVNASAATSIAIIRCWVSQYGTTTSQQLGVELVTQPTSFPSSGTGVTPAKTSVNDPVSQITSGTSGAAGTSGVNYTSEGAGTKVVVYPDAFNNLNGWQWLSTPSEQIVLPAGSASGFGIYLPSTPTTLSGWNAGCTFMEIG